MLRFYLEVARTAFRRQLVYRWANLAGLATNIFFGVIVSYVYIALFQANGQAQRRGQWLHVARHAALHLAGAGADHGRAALRLVRPHADDPQRRGGQRPEQAERLLLVLVQPRVRAQRVLPALPLHPHLPRRDAALRHRRADWLGPLAAVRREPLLRGGARRRLPLPLQHHRLLGGGGAGGRRLRAGDRALLRRQLRAGRLLSALAARAQRLPALQPDVQRPGAGLHRRAEWWNAGARAVEPGRSGSSSLSCSRAPSRRGR